VERGAEHIAIFLRALNGGGAERVMLTLAERFTERGHRVDVVILRSGEALDDLVPPRVRLIDLQPPDCVTALHRLGDFPVDDRRAVLPLLAWKPRLQMACVAHLANYLRRERPDAMLSALRFNTLAAVWAGQLAGTGTRQIVSERNELSVEVASSKRLRHLPDLIHRLYPRADGIIAVSRGVADDLAHTARIGRDRIATIPNPLDLERLQRSAASRTGHPWLETDSIPVILGIGRLDAQTDFETLIRAFSLLCAHRPCLLIILGEGTERPRLEGLVRELGLEHCVSLPGFVDAPAAYLARAALFVLTSRWEGLPNVMIEALGCGCPVVSTNCRSGPSEILDNGKWGRLVPLGNPRWVAAAMQDTLDDHPEPARLRARAEDFSSEKIAGRYLDVLLGGRNDRG